MTAAAVRFSFVGTSLLLIIGRRTPAQHIPLIIFIAPPSPPLNHHRPGSLSPYTQFRRTHVDVKWRKTNLHRVRGSGLQIIITATRIIFCAAAIERTRGNYFLRKQSNLNKIYVHIVRAPILERYIFMKYLTGGPIRYYYFRTAQQSFGEGVGY